MESEKERLDKDMGQQFAEYQEQETKFHATNIQADIFAAFHQRLVNEAKLISNPD